MGYLVNGLRLYAAQVNAQSMGLHGTAGRLKILRKRFRGYHELSDHGKRDKLEWGVAKCKETREHMTSEATDLGRKPEVWDYQGSSGATNKMAKFIGVVGTMVLLGDTIRKLLTEQCGQPYAFRVIAMTATAVVSIFRIADIFFSRDIDESVRNVKKAIDKCSLSYSRQLEEMDRTPPGARKEQE
ncbi:MAG: hypothetical protein AB1295_04065 [Candidatus Micrarchaeota archaeon]